MVKIRSALIATRAALARSAVSGRLMWQEGAAKLEAMGAELPAGRWSQGLFWETHWVEPPFVLHLKAAASGKIFIHGRFAPDAVLASALQHLKHPQAYDKILNDVFPFSCESVVWPVISRNLKLDRRVADHLLESLHQLPAQEVLDFIRIGSHSLPLSARMHADVDIHPCLFCAGPGGDRLGHLLGCGVVWGAMEEAMGVSPSRLDVRTWSWLARFYIAVRHNSARCSLRELARATLRAGSCPLSHVAFVLERAFPSRRRIRQRS